MAKSALASEGDNILVRAGAAVVLAAGATSALLSRRSRYRRDTPQGHRAHPRHRAAEEERPGGIKGKLYDWGDRFPPLGIALRVQDRYGELNGNNLASAVTLSVFLALFPLLIVLVAVVGFFSAGGEDVAQSLVENLGLTGAAADTFTNAVETAEDSRRVASIVGIAGLAWAALGLVGALQYGYDQVWQVRARGIKDKLVGVVWFLGFIVVAGASGVLGAALRYIPEAFDAVGFVAGIVAGVLINFAVFLWTMKVLPNRDVGWRPLVPGAVAAAVAFEALKMIAAYYVPRTIAGSSELYGSIGVIIAVLGFLLLLGKVLIYSAVLNVVLYEQAHGTREVVLEVPATPGIVDDEADRSGQAYPLDKDDPEAKPAA